MTINTNNQPTEKTETDRLVEEFFANGGTITKCKKYARTPADEIEVTYGWGKRRKKTN
jgi:hypothetical protein